MNDYKRNKDVRTLFWGIVLIGAGVLFFLDRMDVFDLHNLLHSWWPLIIVLVGISNLLCRSVARGIAIIAVGVWLQLVTLGMFGLTFNNSWPLLLIVFGASMVLRTFFEFSGGRRRNRELPNRMEDRHEQ